MAQLKARNKNINKTKQKVSNLSVGASEQRFQPRNLMLRELRPLKMRDP
jgi:hypothetical protein